MTPAFPPAEPLTDEEEAELRRFYEANPFGSHAAMVRRLLATITGERVARMIATGRGAAR